MTHPTPVRGRRPFPAAPLAFFALALAAGGRPPAAAQTPPAAPDAVATAAAALQDARSAQRSFEQARRRFAPRSARAWSGSECDERIGRICLRYDEGGDWWPGLDDPRVRGARESLLSDLAAAAAIAPADRWIFGQRIRYLGEAGRWPEAEALARRCPLEARAACDRLLGLALHGQGRYVEAEAAFRAGLSASPADLRARWTDLEAIADEAARAHAGDDAERLWRLADPLFLVEGNDRLTEHWARLAVADLHADAVNAYAMSWGRDLEEILIRFGWEVGWEGVLELGGTGPGGVVGHHHPQARSFVPPGPVLADALGIPPDGWTLSPERPREAYAPPYAPVVIPAPVEILRFPRLDRMAVVALYRMPDDTTEHADHGHPPFEAPEAFRGRPPQAGLFLVRLGSASDPAPAAAGPHETVRQGEPSGVLVAEVPATSYLASVEVWDPERGLAGRLRRSVTPIPLLPGDPELSDLALLTAELPEEAVLERALGALRHPGPLGRTEPLIVGWEVAPPPGSQGPLAYGLTLERTEGGLLARVGAWLGLVDPPEPVRLAWEELPDRGVRAFRSLRVETSELSPGRYRLRLEVALGDRPPIVREREVELGASAAAGGPGSR